MVIKKKKVNFKQYLPLYLMALPALVYLFINNYMPLYGMKLAFTELDYSRGVFNGKFVGLENFRFLFSTSDAWIMIRNTVLYNLLFIVFGTLFSLSVAILFNEIINKTARKFYQSATLIPFVISMVIVSYLAFAFLSNETGFINHSILKPLGIDPISWYQEPKYWPFILLFVTTWHGIGYSLLMYTARIVSIPREYFEAAEIDGATKWQQIKHITLPSLKPVLILMTVLALGRMFNSDFGLFYQLPMNSGALYNVTTTIDTYSFRALMKLGDITMSSATGVFQSVVGFILLIAANAVVRKVSKDDRIF
ncbi:MAG: ABC transporter permease subunit [Neobacillus sp.]